MNFFISIILVTYTAFAQSNLEILNRLVKTEKYGKVVKVIKSPTQVNLLSVDFQFSEIKLNPSEIVYFKIPEEYAEKKLSWIGFSHRQKIQTNDGWDDNPALTTALVYTTDFSNGEFRYWAGSSSGRFGAKFASIGRWPEYDALYEWPRIGHRSVKTFKKSKKLMNAKVVRIQNIGTDDLFFSQLDLKFLPQKSSVVEDYIFTPQSNFGSIQLMQGRFYGGGQRVQGTYPNSVVLSYKLNHRQPELPDNFSVNKNKLIIKLNGKRKFNFIQIMCGDSYPDQIINNDGGYGTSGNARINVHIKNSKTAQSRLIAKNINIPPEGVVMISDLLEEEKTNDGDKIIITNAKTKSPFYIMGLRIGYTE